MILVLFTWILWLVIGAVVGTLAGIILWRRHELTDAVLVGMIGAFIGGLLFNLFSFTAVIDLNLPSIIGALIGAALLSGLYWAVNRQRRTVVVDRENDDIQVGRRWIPIYVPIALLLLLPVLHLALLWLRFPSITTAPPPFGTVASYSNPNGQLNYLVYRPGDGDNAMPLVVLLHGCTQTPTILEAASGMQAVADQNGFMLVYPEQNFISSPHRCWNWYDERNQQRDSGEPSLIMGIVEEVAQQYAVDRSRIYVGGISSGGAMTSILASCYRDVFAAAAVHSGMAYDSANSIFQAPIAPLRGNQIPPEVAGVNAYECAGNAARPIPVLDLHGTADFVVAPINSDHTIEQFAQTNDYADDGSDNDSVLSQPTSSETGQVADGYTYTYERYEYSGNVLMERYIVDGLSHMWSGGTGVFPLSDPKAPNGSQIIWEFFQRYTLGA
jgi:poly(hydroxyalkanoate) depolymerase family esterase